MSVYRTWTTLLPLALVGTLAACGGDSDNDGGDDGNGGGGGSAVLDDADVPDTFSFETRLEGKDGSSVAYGGQTARHVLIDALNAEIASGLQENIDDGTWDATTERDTIRSALTVFYDDGVNILADNDIDVPAYPDNTQQQQFGDLSSDKNLVGKTAGNDDVTDHADWDGGDFAGGSASSPEQQVRAWFTEIVDHVETELGGTQREVDFGGSGSFRLEVYHTEDGRDLKQLTQKFLLGAVTISQGMDDYLDDDVDGKGLLSDNTESDGGAAYTALEHQFDEGFGYFGAARDYMAYTEEEIAGKGGRDNWENGYHDSNGDGTIDLEAEYNFGNSTNAAKRDLGSETGTDFTAGAFEAFLRGRTIINNAVGDDLSEEEMDALKAERDQIVENWEKAIAATVVHYINDTLDEMDNFGSEDYSYVNHTKVFSELKGFALGLQFNPRSPLLEDNDDNGEVDFGQFHDLVGQKPVLPDADTSAIDDYEADLLAARDLMQTAYDFAEADVENW